ncbi:1-acyl-sn-glycerol-3-phosphate acyltransferase [Pseudonocardiaceae bacterium YIM PH 21723]|nr:1-acyl-sn-glycerol-3-phosphate acyltransferase [Pseudonocardiaceae bacterium YIM PH 21723]
MLYRMIKHVSRLLIRLFLRPKIEGLEKVPARGPVIFAINHLSVIDSFIVPILLDRNVSFLAKAEYFKGSRIQAAFFTAVGAIGVQRGAGRSARESLDVAVEVLNAGGSFGIHPEGTRSPDGRLYRGKTGVARLALETGAIVVPVGLIGTENLLPPGSKIPRMAPVTIRFGEPLDFSRYEGMASSLPILRSVTDEIMYSIVELSDQEYVDRYQQPGAAAKAAA